MKALEFENIEYTYKGGTYALKGVNLSVEEGEFVAVLGRNGSGKSTLARLADYLLRVDEGDDEENVPDKANGEASDKKTIEDPFGEGGREVRRNSGFVRVFGMTAEEFEREENRRIEEGKNPRDRMDGIAYVRSHVGIVFQNPDNQTVTSIVEDDVAFGPENMGVPREEIEKRVTEALDAVGMLEYRDRMISSLSGGQKQRVAIAGVLALRPRIMIFDESTAMLDPKGRREIMSVVRKLNREEGVTVFFITHFMEEALQADRAVVMHDGTIVMEGKPEVIFERHGELERYGLTLPKIGQICQKLKEGGMDVRYVLTPEELAEEIKRCVSKSKT